MREEGVSVPLFLRHLFFFPISPSRGSLSPWHTFAVVRTPLTAHMNPGDRTEEDVRVHARESNCTGLYEATRVSPDCDM